MTFQTKPAAAFPVIQAQLAFAVLEAAFDPPAAGHVPGASVRIREALLLDRH